MFVLFCFVLLWQLFIFISSHYDGSHFFYLLDVALIMLFILFADDDCQIIFTLCFERKGYVSSITMSQDVTEDNEDDVDNSLYFVSSYESNIPIISSHVFEYQQVQMVETNEPINQDSDRYIDDSVIDNHFPENITVQIASNSKKDFVRADDNSSRSNASSIIAQNEMKSEKAEAGLKAF